MKLLRSILLVLLLTLPAAAVEIVTVTVTVTSAPNGNTNKITWQGSVRTFTNSISASPSTLIQQTNTPANTATQLLNHFTTYIASGGARLSITNATNFVAIGAPGVVQAVTIAGGWAGVTYTTNTVTSATPVIVPISVYPSAAVRTNVASGIVEAISSATNSLGTNDTALANYLSKGAHASQTVTAPVRLNSVTSIGSLGVSTGGVFYGPIFHAPQMTNGSNFGKSFASFSSDGLAQQFGSSAIAQGAESLAVGTATFATNGGATAIGSHAQAFYRGTSVGGSAVANTNDVAIGSAAIANAGDGGIAIGGGADIGGFLNSIIIGAGIVNDASNQVVLGSGTQIIKFAGPIVGATETNTTWKGTNVMNGRLDFKSRANTSLANGNNAGVILGSNVYVRLSGATTIAAIAGFAAEQDGSFHVVQFTGAITNTFLNESGVDATAANRIVTGIGADLSLTNTPLVLSMIYDATASRWRIVGFLR